MEQNIEKFEYVDTPSGMGGTLPGVVAYDGGDELQVICLHGEFFTNWLFNVRRDQCKPLSYRLDDDMRRIVRRRMH